MLREQKKCIKINKILNKNEKKEKNENKTTSEYLLISDVSISIEASYYLTNRSETIYLN